MWKLLAAADESSQNGRVVFAVAVKWEMRSESLKGSASQFIIILWNFIDYLHNIKYN